MKNLLNLRFSFLFLASLLTLSAVADTTPSKKPSKSTEKTISTYFKFPGVLIPYNGTNENEPVKVEVLFTTGKDGKVNYAYAKTRNLRLKKEIEKQFSTFELPQVKQGVAHSVVLNFKYLDGGL